MQEITVQNLPNQEIAFTNEGNSFVISLRSFGNTDEDTLLFATVELNGEWVSVSQRCVPGGWLIPQPYLTDDCGNFRFECDNEDYPYYGDFGTTCKLMFYSDSEYKAEVED